MESRGPRAARMFPKPTPRAINPHSRSECGVGARTRKERLMGQNTEPSEGAGRDAAALPGKTS